MKRREFLKRGLQSVALLVSGIVVPPAFAAIPSGKPALSSLPAFLDTLIPADETPSASALALDDKLYRHAMTIRNYVALLELGCQWLDAQAGALGKNRFHMLDERGRERIVALAESSPVGSIPRQLFDHVRSDLFGFYYAHPASWIGLGLDAPPQPRGYPDYVQPPKRTKA